MPTVAALNNQATTDAPQVFNCRGARNVEVTISNASVYLAFASTLPGGVIGSPGVEEFHTPKILTISDEPISAVQYRSAKAGAPAQVTVIATS